MEWRKRPILYEISTWAWLADLTTRYREPITLENVPAPEWDALAALHVDAVWFMGVWERSPRGMDISNANADLQNEFARALSDYTVTDNVGSAYCVRAYEVDERLGGTKGLARARAELAQRGVRVILDFVPNHIAPDHAWTETHPEFLVRGTLQDLERSPAEFIKIGEQVFAHGRDPYFPPWRDVVQVNAFDAGLRAAMRETVNALAMQCDGIRCDMAMLMLNAVFAKTWAARGDVIIAGAIPETEFWRELIPAVKQPFPDFLFIAEAYWDLEFELMQNGFDYCYDKPLYDVLVRDTAERVRTYLSAGADYQDKLVRFVENHDEARVAATFALLQERAAAIIVATVPGAKIFHDGQFDGRKIRLPVFLARRAVETKNYELESFYRALLKALDAEWFHAGEWNLCACSGWSDNASYQNIVAWTWEYENERALIVVNYSAQRSQAMVGLTWEALRERVWRLSDALNGDVFLRDGNQLRDAGLFVDLDAWRFHFLRFE